MCIRDRYRDVRFRSYEKLKSEGRTVQIENYQQVYIGRIQPGETPADIKLRLQKQRPKNFKGHSIGCSDVIIITDDGKTTAYYVNKDGFIIIPEFLTIKSSSDTRPVSYTHLDVYKRQILERLKQEKAQQNTAEQPSVQKTAKKKHEQEL